MNQLTERIQSAEPAAIAASAASMEDVLELVKLKRPLQRFIAELRADLLPDPQSVTFSALALRGIMPILLTPRHVSESGGVGGFARTSDQMAMFEASKGLVDGFDVEFRSEIRDEVVALANQAGLYKLLSYHNFIGTNDLSELNDIFEQALKAGADGVKFALTMGTPEDYSRGEEFVRQHAASGRLTVVGMNHPDALEPYGSISRTTYPTLGSQITYGCIGEPLAPGQVQAVYIDDVFSAMPNAVRLG